MTCGRRSARANLSRFSLGCPASFQCHTRGRAVPRRHATRSGAIFRCSPSARRTRLAARPSSLTRSVSVQPAGVPRAGPRYTRKRRKRLLTIALDGDICTHIDNVDAPSRLARRSRCPDRAGPSKTVCSGRPRAAKRPCTWSFFASGNNMTLQGGHCTSCRCQLIWIQGMERPEAAPASPIPLLLHGSSTSTQVLVAALNDPQSLLSRPAAQHKTSLPYGSFEAWSAYLVRQALIWAGKRTPAKAARISKSDSDPEFDRLCLGCSRPGTQCYGTQPQTLKRVPAGYCPLYAGPALPHRINGMICSRRWGSLDDRFDGKRLDSRLLGEAFTRWRGRPIDGKRLVKVGVSHKTAEWGIELLHTR